MFWLQSTGGWIFIPKDEGFYCLGYSIPKTVPWSIWHRFHWWHPSARIICAWNAMETCIAKAFANRMHPSVWCRVRFALFFLYLVTRYQVQGLLIPIVDRILIKCEVVSSFSYRNSLDLDDEMATTVLFVHSWFYTDLKWIKFIESWNIDIKDLMPSSCWFGWTLGVPRSNRSILTERF